MEINSLVFHPNALVIEAKTTSGFWVKLSDEVGYGYFEPIDKTNCDSTQLKLTKVQQELSQLQGQLVCSSNVLWRLKEALEVAKSRNFFPSQVD